MKDHIHLLTLRRLVYTVPKYCFVFDRGNMRKLETCKAFKHPKRHKFSADLRNTKTCHKSEHIRCHKIMQEKWVLCVWHILFIGLRVFLQMVNYEYEQ